MTIWKKWGRKYDMKVEINTESTLLAVDLEDVEVAFLVREQWGGF